MLWPGVVRWYIIKYPWLDGIGLPKYGSIIFSFKNSLSVLQELSSNVSKIDILYKLLQNKFEQFSCKMKEQFCVKDKGFNQFDIAFIICKIKSCLSPMRFKHDTMWYCLNPFESLPEICFARVGPKFEPCYVSLQVVVLSEATYNVHAWIQLPCQQISSPCIKHDFLNCCKGSIQPHPIFCCLLALSLSPFMYRCRSLRKVMLRTCLDTADTSTKEFPTATSTTPATAQPSQPSQATSYSAEKAIYDNGDIFGNKTTDNTVYRQTIAFTDQIPIPIPEDIPGLPIHRPGEYSPSYDRRSTRG